MASAGSSGAINTKIHQIFTEDHTKKVKVAKKVAKNCNKVPGNQKNASRWPSLQENIYL
jgi:hypothetical protein